MAFSISDGKLYSGSGNCSDYRIKSTDEKPVKGVTNMSTLLEFGDEEVKLYIYDIEIPDWVLIAMAPIGGE